MEVIRSIRESKSGWAPPPRPPGGVAATSPRAPARARSSPISEADCNEALLAPAEAWAWTIWPSKASRWFGSAVCRAKSKAGANSPASRNARSRCSCSWGCDAWAAPAARTARRGAAIAKRRHIGASKSCGHHCFSFRCWGDREIIAQGSSATAIAPAGLSP